MEEKLIESMGFLYRAGQFPDKKCIKTIYFSCIYSCLNYATYFMELYAIYYQQNMLQNICSENILTDKFM